MSQLRLNLLTGRWVTIASNRATRPEDFVARQLAVESDPDRPCPFCVGHEESTPPALETYGSDGGWRVRVVPNLYPAFDGDTAMRVEHVGPTFTKAEASGIHEVLVLSPDHLRAWDSLDDKQVGLVMAAIRDRVEDHARHNAVRYTQVIVNHGREAGASLEHGHGQLLGIPFVPGEIVDEMAGFRRFGESCLLCTLIEAEQTAEHRTVIDEERVLVVAPFWSGVPYELLVLPRTHGTSLDHASPADLVAVGKAIRDALALLVSTLGDLSYNLVFHTAPHHHELDPFHWHVHLLPRLTTAAGFEQGTGVMINIVPPETARRHLVGAVTPQSVPQPQ